MLAAVPRVMKHPFTKQGLLSWDQIPLWRNHAVCIGAQCVPAAAAAVVATATTAIVAAPPAIAVGTAALATDGCMW